MDEHIEASGILSAECRPQGWQDNPEASPSPASYKLSIALLISWIGLPKLVAYCEYICRDKSVSARGNLFAKANFCRDHILP